MVRTSNLPILWAFLLAPSLLAQPALALDIMPADYAPRLTSGTVETPVGDVIFSGDISGDGLSDLILGIPSESTVAIFVGSREDEDWSSLDKAIILEGTANTAFGASLALLPASESVGIRLVVGAPGSNRGGSVVVYDAAAIFEGSSTPSPLAVLNGSSESGLYGVSLAVIPDPTSRSDGNRLIIGAPGEGAIYGYATANLASDAQLFKYTQSDSGLGAALTVGDFDGDAALDLACGAPSTEEGSVFLIKDVLSIAGSADAETLDFDSEISGQETGARFGQTLATTPPLLLNSAVGEAAAFTPGDNLLVGSPAFSSGEGLVDLIHGTEALEGGKSPSLRIYSLSSGNIPMSLGDAVTFVGTVGTLENVIAVGAPDASTGGCSRCGAGFLISLEGLTTEASPVSVLEAASLMVQGQLPGTTAGTSVGVIEMATGTTALVGVPGLPASSLVAFVGADVYEDADGDGLTPAHGDCNDSAASALPGAIELCNGIDDDCDRLIDEDAQAQGYVDLDDDGYGDGDPVLFSGTCTLAEGYAPQGGDCAPDDNSTYPGAPELCDGIDNDCDGIEDNGPVQVYNDSDGDGFGAGDPVVVDDCSALGSGLASNSADCDDSDGGANPNATETCDLVDNNCDGLIDEGFETDADADGSASQVCGGDDCDDSNPAVNPDAPELCDGADNDCDEIIDEGLDQDSDGDGQSACQGDCDDDDPDRYLGATEVCDGKDNDCNEVIDDPFDRDLDGDPDPALCPALGGDCNDNDPRVSSLQEEACDEGIALDNDCDGIVDEFVRDDLDGDGFTVCNNDCDDTDASISPVSEELCDGIDNDCDDIIDDGITDDNDGDGLSFCEGDCDDDNPEILPGVDEVCDGRDNDCDGESDEAGAIDGPCDQYDDNDGDGSPSNVDCDDNDPQVNPDAPEICDGKDNDCDGSVRSDEGDTDGDGNIGCSTSLEDADCDDNDPTVYQGADELCDNKDNDCNGILSTEENDSDRDGVMVCEGDCDDSDRGTKPGAEEECDGEDNDCDDTIDEGLDGDSDGFCGDEDCDDTNSEINTDAAEVLGNTVDENCDGLAPDQDGDGYCLSPTNDAACLEGIDCDDTDADINPEADIIEGDGIDQDCDGDVDETPPTPTPSPTPVPTPTATQAPVELPPAGLNGTASDGLAFSCSQQGQGTLPGASFALLAFFALGLRRRKSV